MTITESNEIIDKLFKAEQKSQSFVAAMAIARTTEKFGKDCTAESTAYLMAKTQRLSFTHGALTVMYHLGLIDDPKSQEQAGGTHAPHGEQQ